MHHAAAGQIRDSSGPGSLHGVPQKIKSTHIYFQPRIETTRKHKQYSMSEQEEQLSELDPEEQQEVALVRGMRDKGDSIVNEVSVRV